VAHPGASMHPGSRHKPPAAAIGPGPLGPGLMVYGAGRGAGQGAAAAAAADMGKPPLPKPSMRAAAAAAAVDYGGSAQQQAGVHALINPGGINPGAAAGAAGINPGAALQAGFVPHGRSPSSSQGLPAPALNPDLLAHFAGAAGGAGQGFGVLASGSAAAAAAAGGSNVFAAVGKVGGLCGIPDHPAAVPHTRRPRSAQPPRWALCRTAVQQLGLSLLRVGWCRNCIMHAYRAGVPPLCCLWCCLCACQPAKFDEFLYGHKEQMAWQLHSCARALV
jgi:hypothetical protein